MIQQLTEWGYPRHDAADALDLVNFRSVEEAESLIHSEARKYDASQHLQLEEPGVLPKALKLHHMRAEIEKIVEMGFSEDVANRALSHCGGDVSVAIACLLGE